MLAAGLTERVSDLWLVGLSGIASDFRQSVRIYHRHPLLGGAIAATLALTAGPALAVTVVLYQLVLAPLPYTDPESLVVIRQPTTRSSGSHGTAANVSDYRAVDAFSMVGGVLSFLSTVSINGQEELLPNYRTTGGLLSGLGVRFAVGRDLAPGQPEVVVTRRFAQQRFGADERAIGRPLTVDGLATTIVGVVADRPAFPYSGAIDVFAPHPDADRVDPSRSGNNTQLIARIKPGVAHEVALTQANAVASGLTSRSQGQSVIVELRPLKTTVVGSIQRPLVMLLGAAGALFLLALSSLTGLVVLRFASRLPDVTVRVSLGASRSRLVRAWLLDGAALALPGTVVGSVLALWLVSAAHPSLPTDAASRMADVFPGVLLVAGVGFMLITMALFTLAPIAAGALRRSRLGPALPMRGVTVRSRGILRGALIVGQVAVSLALVTSTAWLSISLFRILSRPVGFNPEGVVVVVQSDSVLRPEQQADVARLMIERLRQTDPLALVAAATSIPGTSGSGYRPAAIRTAGDVDPNNGPRFIRFGVSSDFFRVLGIPLVAGRFFTPADEAAKGTAVILGQSFADRWFPDGAVGKTVFTGARKRHVVGVVRDVHAAALDDETSPQFYVPMTDTAMIATPSQYLLRTSRSADDIRADATGILEQLDPSAKTLVASAAELMADPISARRMSSAAVAALAIVAVLLALISVYALSAFAVIERTREIGIRMALGARRIDALRLVTGRSAISVLVGLAVGAVLTSGVAAPLLSGQMYETSTRDIGLLASAAGVLLVVAVLASWLPARRAARIDPAVTLRAE